MLSTGPGVTSIAKAGSTPLSGAVTLTAGTNHTLTQSGQDVSIALSGTVAVTNGGTGTGTAFTAGSVIFAGTSGVYSQDNANLFWDDTQNYLGIGTAPTQHLHIVGGAAVDGGILVDMGSIANLRLRKTDATAQSWILRTETNRFFKLINETLSGTTVLEGNGSTVNVQDELDCGTFTTSFIDCFGDCWVQGEVVAEQDSGNTEIAIGTAAASAERGLRSDSSGDLILRATANNPASIYYDTRGTGAHVWENRNAGDTAWTELARLTTTGLGIGVTPAALLHIQNGTFRITNPNDSKTTDLGYDSGQGYFYIDEYGTNRQFIMKNGGYFGFGAVVPSAVINIKAGTATANTAPMKFTSGTNLTSPEAGAVEWDGAWWYGTQTDTTARKVFGMMAEIQPTNSMSLPSGVCYFVAGFFEVASGKVIDIGTDSVIVID